ncbi:MAG: beta-ketoacyl-[acyl-carrier-protein] synthase family protein [Clostridiales bacterium]|nr:beta-ketoacyl-[acyl-carrier-protein] synthase family protein [Clostridiales bacterium]
MRKRIVITGMGAVTPVGVGAEKYWSGLVRGDCGIGDITRIDASRLPVKKAAEVRNFDPREHLPARLVKDLDTFMQYAFVAAEEAICQSRIDIDPLRTGVVMGTALAGLALIGATQEGLIERGKQAGPRFVSQILGNMAASNLAIKHGIRGPSLTVSTACSSGGDAITLAAMLIETGSADAVVVMAGESAPSPLFIQSLSLCGAMSSSGRSRPFDKDRDGFVMGEGGGALILETLDSASRRGAEVRAELLGYANNTDAYHPVAPREDGGGAAACMRTALNMARLEPRDIDYVNAHGTATVKGDFAEAAAIRAVFGDIGVPVSSTKGATGHMMGAGGITEVIACVKAINTGLLPATLGCTEKDNKCDIDVVTGEFRRARVRAAMSNAMGFGGQNSSIIVGEYTG